MKNIRDYIYFARLQKGYSQEYVAYLLGISQQAYSLLERYPERFTLSRFMKVKEILGIEELKV